VPKYRKDSAEAATPIPKGQRELALAKVFHAQASGLRPSSQIP